MKSREPVFEKSRSVEDLEHMRLTALLREMVREKGKRKASEALDVDHRTLVGSLKRGRLSRRMRVSLDKALLEGGGSPAAEQRERNDDLEERVKNVEGRVEAQGKGMSKGFAAVQGDVKAVKNELAQGLRQVGQRLTKLEGGGDAQVEVEEANVAGGKTQRRTAPWREYPDLVTREPAEGDEDVFGEAWPLIAEWRELKNAHPNRGKGLEWLRDEEWLLVMELALLEEHGMTLPPEKQPLRDFARNGQINWRQAALYDTRRALARRELLLRVMRIVTLRLWRR